MRKERKREEYKRIIHSKRWSMLSKAYKAAHPFCEECVKKGIWDQPSEEVHHVRPIGTGKTWDEMLTLAFDVGNLEALCHDCHTIVHQKMKRERNRRRGVDGEVARWLRDNFGLYEQEGNKLDCEHRRHEP